MRDDGGIVAFRASTKRLSSGFDQTSPSLRIPIFGVPRLHMAGIGEIGRPEANAGRVAPAPDLPGMGRTTVTDVLAFIRPELTGDRRHLTLLSNAGMIAVDQGDSRCSVPKRGKGSNGAFAPCRAKSPAHLLPCGRSMGCYLREPAASRHGNRRRADSMNLTTKWQKRNHDPGVTISRRPASDHR